MHNIFVYGTLMKGFRNHIAMLGSKCISNDAVIEGYAMYNVGPYPAIVKEDGGKVRGEFYKVSSMKIKTLNRIEGEGFLYKRTPVKVKVGDEEMDGETYVYLLDVSDLEKIPFEKQPWRVEYAKYY